MPLSRSAPGSIIIQDHALQKHASRRHQRWRQNAFSKSVLVQHAPSLKLQMLPGTPAASSAAPKKPRAAVSGSAAELAEKHPVVQQAKRIFAADISNVIDLRNKRLAE